MLLNIKKNEEETINVNVQVVDDLGNEVDATQEHDVEENDEEIEFPPTLPKIKENKLATLKAMDLTAKVFAAVEQYRGMTLTDLEDVKGYKAISANRKFVKSMRVQAKKACVAGREDLVAGQKEWVALEKELEAWFLGIEEPLEKQEKAYEAEQDRKKKIEQDRINKRTESRMQLLRDVEAAFDMISCSTLSDEQWADYYVPLAAANTLRLLGIQRSKLLKECEVEILPSDAGEMTESDFDKFLSESRESFQIRKDKAAADALIEAERIAAEKAKADRYMERFNSLAKLGKAVSDVGLDLDKLREMEDSEFAQVYRDVLDAKEKADREILLDNRFKHRYAELIEIGVVFNTDIGRSVREMEPFEYETYLGTKRIEWNAAQKKIKDDADELARLRAKEEVKPVEAPAPKIIPFPSVEDYFNVPSPDHVVVQAPNASLEIELTEEGPSTTSVLEPETKQGDSEAEQAISWALKTLNQVNLAPSINDPENSALMANYVASIKDTLQDIIDLFPVVG